MSRIELSSIDPWLPHPLANFGIAGEFVDGLFADIILHFIDATVMEEPYSQQYNPATWFLLASERTYFYVCAEAVIDAVKLRDHLKSCAHRCGGGEERCDTSP